MRGRYTAAKAIDNMYPRTVIMVEAVNNPTVQGKITYYVDIIQGEHINEDTHTRTPPQQVRISGAGELVKILRDLMDEAGGKL